MGVHLGFEPRTSCIKDDHTLMAKQAEFVNKDLSNGSNTISVKKFLTHNIQEETEWENPYQKTLIMGHENKIEQNDQKGEPCTNKRMVHIE